MMSWASPDSWLTRLLSGSPLAILIAFIATITLPALLHWYFYTTSPQSSLTPTFLLLGPSGSGKTSFASLLQHHSPRSSSKDEEPSTTAAVATRSVSPTRTSQVHSTIRLSLPGTIALGSNKYRSANDHEVRHASEHSTPYNVTDTPGHGKLRSEQALSHIRNPATKGIIFMVDSSAFDASSSTTSAGGGDSYDAGNHGVDATRDTATYLHDTLLALQRRKLGTKKVKAAKTDVPVLIAANKQDLFTALPAGAVSERLEGEIEKIRRTRRKGISKVDDDPDADEGDEEEENVLGGGGEGVFSFKLMEEEFGIVVNVVGGAIRGDEEGKGVRKWEEWIGSCL